MTATPQHMAHAIRALAMDAVQAANSGHPGMPMGMAEIAVALWSRHFKHNPRNPQWPNRDRFVLSNGHGSMLLYALLHLTGYGLGMDDLRAFRQLHSRTPGHPEVGITPGVETTTGPLGQGIANAVGMALAERLLAAQFNEPEFAVVDHHTFVFLGDGCLMEGISHEACALAGTLRLSKLIVLYDDNGISIDGQVQPWFSDNTPQRFAAYGWNVIADVDGHNIDAVDDAIAQAKRNAAQGVGPTLICCKTNIGQGSPALAGSDKVHGAPLGQAEIAATRAAIGWPHAPFEMPPEVYQAWDAQVQGAAQEGEWQALWAGYQAQYPAKAAELQRRLAGELPQGFAQYVQQCVAEVDAKAETLATRKASQNAIAMLAAKLPELLGGSADLTGSNLTNWPGCGAVRASMDGFQAGGHINWGVREFGMAAALNGVALHGGFVPFGGTFLTFSDYSRNALRMAALMKQRVVHVFTHDSIGLGEDGPTHQPVEHAASLRLIPGLDVWRPADAVETMVAWGAAVQRGGGFAGNNGHSGGHGVGQSGPTALLLSRQNLRHNPRSASVLANIAKGGYVLVDGQDAQVTLLACGSELELAVAAQAALAERGVAARVVSMPSTTVFDRQEASYRAAVLGKLPLVVVDAGVPDGWYKYLAQAGVPGTVLGMTTFGESAPAPALYQHFGLTVGAVVAAAKNLL